MRKCVTFILLCGVLGGCMIGPNYKKPSLSVPDTYRGLSREELELRQMASLGQEKWWEVFQDSKLQDLMHTALQQNNDVRIDD